MSIKDREKMGIIEIPSLTTFIYSIIASITAILGMIWYYNKNHTKLKLYPDKFYYIESPVKKFPLEANRNSYFIKITIRNKGGRQTSIEDIDVSFKNMFPLHLLNVYNNDETQRMPITIDGYCTTVLFLEYEVSHFIWPNINAKGKLDITIRIQHTYNKIKKRITLEYPYFEDIK